MKLKTVLSIFIVTATVFIHCDAFSGEKDNASDGTKALKVSAGYDLWYAMWKVKGFALDDTTNVHKSSDFKIDPTFIHGLSFSAESGSQKKGGWNVMLDLYGDYINRESSNASGKKTDLLKALVSYGISDDKQLMTQIQTGNFKGELAGESSFSTKWTKIDLLLANPKSGFGYGVRYLQYRMPVEFSHVSKAGADLGHVTYDTDTTGIAFVVKSTDPINFGKDNGKWYYLDGDFAFGISSAKAKELTDDVYGFQFNSQIDAGVKKAFKVGQGLVALKAGYRVFFDAQILSEWINSNGANTTSTLRNFFHGPFVGIVGSF